MHFTVIDIETTGLSANYHKITEIAALKYDGKKVTDQFCTLVDPETPIPRFITKLTGIDDEMVRGAPKIKKAISEFHSFLDNSAFVAHNATFDYNFLDHALRSNHGISLNNHKVCTCKLARRLLPELPSKKLSALCEHYNIINEKAHRAMADTKATVKVFENFLKILKQKEIHQLEDILRFQKSKIPRSF